MKILAIIPARGGSKGIPHKNISMLHGKPLVAWTIEAALSAKSVDKVIVSTNDAEIEWYALQYEVEVVVRPDELATDEASTESVLLHTLAHLKGYEPDIIVLLQCTSPLTTGEEIDEVVGSLIDNKADSALSVVPFHYFLWNGNGEGINHDKRERLLRQEREAQYIETGGVYVMRTKGFLEAKHRFFGKIMVHICNDHSPHLEIDELQDLTIAEALLKERENG